MGQGEKKGAMEGRKGPRTEGKGWKGPRWEEEAQERKKVPNEGREGRGHMESQLVIICV